MPSTKASTWPRLVCVNVNQMEAFVLGHKRRSSVMWGIVNVSLSVLYESFKTVQSFQKKFPNTKLVDGDYRAAGDDQVSITFEGLEAAQHVIANPQVLSAAADLNLRLMRKGGNIYAQYHCFDLAADLL